MVQVTTQERKGRKDVGKEEAFNSNRALRSSNQGSPPRLRARDIMIEVDNPLFSSEQLESALERHKLELLQ